MTTLPFQVARGRMVRFLLMRHALWWLLAMAVVAIVLIAIGVAVDLRICVLGLVVVCLCLPMAVAMVLIAHGLAPANALNMLPHRIVIAPQSLTVEVIVPADGEDEERIEKRIVIDKGRLDAYTVIEGAIAIPVRDAKPGSQRSDGVLILPYTAFDSTDQFRQAIAMLPEPLFRP